MNRLCFKNRHAFTLVELLIVCFIIGILTAAAVPGYRRAVQRTRVAEAHTLLRAIYDSCERMAWENQLSNCGKAVERGVATFRKMDTLAKGTFVGNTQLQTENFLYSLPANSSNNFITAAVTKGDYSGTTITFDGRNFTCTSGTSGEAAKACAVWGATTWNQ